MSAALVTAKAMRAKEADRQAQQQAAIERLPPSPRTPAGGWIGPFPTPSVETIERPRADAAELRQRLDQERARIARAAEPRARPPQGVTWRPTPTLYESNVTAASGNPVMTKVWDTSPPSILGASIRRSRLASRLCR